MLIDALAEPDEDAETFGEGMPKPLSIPPDGPSALLGGGPSFLPGGPPSGEGEPSPAPSALTWGKYPVSWKMIRNAEIERIFMSFYSGSLRYTKTLGYYLQWKFYMKDFFIFFSKEWSRV
jgi:hypothetical protein